MIPEKTASAKTAITLIAAFLVSVMLGGCNIDPEQVAGLVESMAKDPEMTQQIIQEAADVEKPEEDLPSLPTRDIYVLCTSDIHCGVDQGFGYAGLAQIRDNLKAEGCDIILVDDGDHVQGEAIGTITRGEAIIPIMNAMQYDVAIPGNHEFDYGLDELMKYTELADFPYISCNFTKEGKPVFSPYIIKEAGGMRFAFVGVTTPNTMTSESPEYFRDENGNTIYGFMQGDGKRLYKAVQDAVDAALAEGVDYVYVMAHIGNIPDMAPYTCMDIIANTTGIDVFLDGHSHDLDRMVLKNRDGRDVVRIACGYKFSGIGYSHIKAKDGSIDTGIWTWENDKSVPELLAVKNDMSTVIDNTLADMEDRISEVIARTDDDLLMHDPVKAGVDEEPARMVRNRETNLGDLCADAVRVRTGADIGIVNGGGIREDIRKGDITYGDILCVHPFGNNNVVIAATGQQIADALEWSCRSVPDEEGGFLQVSGLRFKVDTTVKSGCTSDECGVMTGITGKRRVSDIMIGDNPIDLSAKYTVAGNEFLLLENGSGFTAFDGAEVINENAGLDNQQLIEYITDNLGGIIGDQYSDPYGEQRIKIDQ